jgi:large subunit ribosomal protein L9
MEVILLERVGKLGAVGSVVKVKDGYARNFLIPQGKVLRATNENKALFESRKADIEKENAKKKAENEKEAVKLEGIFVVVTRQAGDDGRLYGSVNSRDIAEAAVAAGHTLKRSQIDLNNPIKAIGVYEQKVVLHAEVVVNIRVNVARSEDEAEQARVAYLNPKAAEKTEEASIEEKEEKPKKKSKAKAAAEESAEAAAE